MPGGGNKRGRKRAEGEQEEEFDMAFVDEDVEMVDVDFAFFEPFESDFHGVRALLQKAFEFCKRAPILDISEIADVACNQGNIGTVLKSGDEEGLFGIYTAVNLRQYKASFAQSLTGFVSFLARFGGAELCTCIESLEEMETATGTTTKNSSSSKRIDHAAPVPSIAQPTSGGNKASCSTSSKTASSRKHSLSVTDLVGAGDGSVAGKVAAWIENKNVGLLINERIINLPEEPYLTRPSKKASNGLRVLPSAQKTNVPFISSITLLASPNASKTTTAWPSPTTKKRST
ncbi:unnamed protein product [Amoebophrya sp. A25]|nr:unnamed protein product [Amoebophrya sp. A25]|eukprot:GSA25T00019481001.1